jgi:hypothetical protein
MPGRIVPDVDRNFSVDELRQLRRWNVFDNHWRTRVDELSQLPAWNFFDGGRGLSVDSLH